MFAISWWNENHEEDQFDLDSPSFPGYIAEYYLGNRPTEEWKRNCAAKSLKDTMGCKCNILNTTNNS